MQHSLWTQLRPVRLESRLTLQEIAHATGSTHGHLSRAERGQVGLTLDLLEKYLAACGAHLQVVRDDTPEAMRLSVASLPPEQQELIRTLIEVLPSLPDALVDDLRDRARQWKGRFSGPDE